VATHESIIRRWDNGAKVSVVAAIAAGLVLAIMAIIILLAQNPSPTDSATDTSEDSDVQPYDPTVDTIPVAAQCGPVEESKPWNTYSTPEVEPGNLDKRQYSTAIVRPYTATTAVESRAETFEINCADMTELSQWYLEAVNLPETIVVKDWINAFNTTVAENGLDSFYEVGPGGTTVVTALGRVYAQYMNAFILQFQMDGLQARDDSVRFWQMGPYTPQHVPSVQLSNKKDPKESWLYTWNDKFEQCLWRLGVNPAGGELVVYTCGTPAPEPTPTSTNPSHVPTCEELYGPGWTGRPPVCKDPEDNAVYNNPDANPFYNGNTPTTTSDGDGSKVANGNQGTEADVLAAQEAAAAKAAAEQAERDEAARKAAEDAANKPANQGGTTSTDAGW
jgi:hypothetical protein